MRYITVILAVLLVALSGNIGAYEFDIGRQCGMGGTILLSKPSATDRLACPAAVSSEGQIDFEAGYQRKFELADLDRFFVTAGYRYNDFSVTFGFSQFGRSDYYTEQIARGALSYTVRQFTASVIADGKQVSVGEAEDNVTLRAGAVGFAAGVDYESYHLSVIIDNINRPKLEKCLVAENTVYHIYGEIEGRSRFSIVGHIAFEEHEKPLAALGQYVRFIDEHALFWGISSNPLTYGGGLEIKYHNYGLMYAVSYHPTLGFTHNVSLNLASGGIFR